MKSDFLRLDNVEFSKIGKFPSVGIQILVIFFWFAQSENIQNVVKNDEKLKDIWASQFLQAATKEKGGVVD